MPLLKEEITASGSKLYIWKVADDDPDSEDWYDQSKSYSAKRRIELKGIRLLRLHARIFEVNYLPNGKPVIDSGHISFSHSGDLVAMIVSEKPVGLDIQVPTEKLFNISTRFCNDRELEKHGKSLEDLTRIWCTKEAVFKVYGENVSFGEQMDVTLEGDSICCQVQEPYNRDFNLVEERIEEHFLVYTL